MKTKANYTPKQLYEILSKTVIGQEDYLKKLSNTVWLHSKRLEVKDKVSEKRYLQKYNLLCVGPTGSGKTLAVTTLAKLYGFDVGIFNSVDFTGAGWKGRDTDEIIQEMYMICDRSKERTERAIIVLDEFDKMLLQKNGSGDSPSFGAENSMLKLIEGMKVTVKSGDFSSLIDTSNILFIAAGAFEGIEKIVQRRTRGGKALGFTTEKRFFEEDEDLYSYIRKEDLLEYGIGAQLLGRFSDVAHLRRLGVEDLKHVLRDSDASAIHCMDVLLSLTCDVDLEIDETAIHAVAVQAYEEQTGARGLTQILMPVLQEVIFNLDITNEVRKIVITADERGKLKADISTLWVNEEPAECFQDVTIDCHIRKNSVECFVDYILSAYPDLNHANIREVRAAHALLCSLVFYLLIECNESDQTVTGLQKLLYVATPSKDPNSSDQTVCDVLLHDKAMDYSFYFDKFLFLDKSLKSAELAKKALDAFAVNPEYKLKSLI